MDATLDLTGGLRRFERLKPAAPAAEASLVDRARRGDAEAFGMLYEIYAGMVHGILLSRLPQPAVEDLVQDVFLLAYRRLDTLRDPAAFGPWVAAIARNRAADYHRRAPDMEPLSEDLPAPAEGRCEALEVLDIIRALPEAYRETLILRFAEGLTGPEIAERTGLTSGSVRVNLHRGTALLKERLAGRNVNG
jgi:RNA polymerase sigma-70 factor (ECF subfamily)